MRIDRMCVLMAVACVAIGCSPTANTATPPVMKVTSRPDSKQQKREAPPNAANEKQPPNTEITKEEMIARLIAFYRNQNPRPWRLLKETPATPHDVPCRIGQPITDVIAVMGKPRNFRGQLELTDIFHLCDWDHIKVSVGSQYGAQSVGLIYDIHVDEGFKGEFYGLRIGDSEEKAWRLYGKPDYNQVHYRRWSLEKHGVRLGMSIRNGAIKLMSVDYFVPTNPMGIILYDQKTGYPGGAGPPY